MPVNKIDINYTYLSMDRTTGKYESKYLLDYLKHQLILGIGYNLPYSVNHNLFIRFEERINFSPYWIVDTQISKQLNKFFLFIRGTNIFNKSRSDFAGLPLPGRWISFGINYNI